MNHVRLSCNFTFFKVILFCFIFPTFADMVMSAAKKTTSAKVEKKNI